MTAPTRWRCDPRGRWLAVGSLALLVAVFAAGASWAPGCITPPVLLETHRGALDPRRYPPGSELVELPQADGSVLRGVFVPARGVPPDGRSAPVVLDLLESGGTVLVGARDQAITATFDEDTDDEPLREEWGTDGAPDEDGAEPYRAARRRLSLLPLLGFSVLCLDWAGTGASDGVRSSGNLSRDARAAFEEARHRAGGDPARVVLRGTSIGALAAAALLHDGVQPGAVVLVAPVRAETVVEHGARAMGRGVLEGLVGWLLAEPVDADLLAQVRAARLPLLVVVPERDAFLPRDERLLLRAAVQEAGGAFAVRRSGHLALAAASRDVLDVEAWFLAGLPLVPSETARLVAEAAAEGSRGAVTRDAEARDRLERLVRCWPLAAPGLLAASDLAGHTTAERRAYLDLVAWLPGDPPDPESAWHLASLDDPAGRLDVTHMVYLRGMVPGIEGVSLDQLAGWLAQAGPDPAHVESTGATFSVDGWVEARYPTEPAESVATWVNLTRRTLVECSLAESDLQRQILRLALKAAGRSDRLIQADDGRWLLECRDAGRWLSFEVSGWRP